MVSGRDGKGHSLWSDQWRKMGRWAVEKAPKECKFMEEIEHARKMGRWAMEIGRQGS